MTDLEQAKRVEKTRMLLALNAKARADGGNVFQGISPVEKARRRSLNERQKASRKVNR